LAEEGEMTRVLLVDPSLFTAPYDAALSMGLKEAGVEPRWAVRDLREGEEADLPASDVALRCYRSTDGRYRRGRVAKGLEHAADLWRLTREARRTYDVVHFQWTPLPLLDARAMQYIRRTKPVVLTVHDTTPFNGAKVARLQVYGFDALFDSVDRIIVHTGDAHDLLLRRGVAPDRLAVIPHGPLALAAAPRPVADKAAGRWRVVLFGRLQNYKGIDVLVEALGRLPEAERDRLEVVIAGEALMDLAPVRARAQELGLSEPVLRWRPRRLSHQDLADLLGSADAFVFPYSAIEASGVLFLVAGLDKWVIASALGAFNDLVGTDGRRGRLVPPGDAAALADALVQGIGRAPDVIDLAANDGWTAIGQKTAGLYRSLLNARIAA
jgi:glycosyltransferase involved in cell wall biosynthesis